MGKAISFTIQRRGSRFLCNYLSIRHQFVNPQWAVGGRSWSGKIPGVPRLPDEFGLKLFTGTDLSMSFAVCTQARSLS